MEPIIIGIISIVALLALMFLGVHIAVALAAVAFTGLILVIGDLDSALSLTVRSFYLSTSRYTFTVLPLFIIMGYFATIAGITEKGYNLASKWLSGVKAGLYLVTTASCAIFAAATGSSAATTAAVGKTVLPEMEKHGYNKTLSLGCVAASGTLGVLIPPSIPMVLYGIVTEESIGRLLIAGIFPGVLSALIYMAGMMLLIRLRPNLGPPITRRAKWKERFQAIPGVWGIALLFGVVVGGIYSGVFTPTEAGAWGAFAAMLMIALRTRKGFFSEAAKAGWNAAVMSATIFFLIMAAMVFTRFLTLAGVVDSLVEFVVGGGFSPIAALAMFLFVGLIMGMFISASALLLLLAPIMHAILVPLGFDGIWLGIIMIKILELAFITPPVGGTVFVAKALVPEVPVQDVFRGIIPFVIMDLITIVILVAFPQICTWLPTIAFR